MKANPLYTYLRHLIAVFFLPISCLGISDGIANEARSAPPSFVHPGIAHQLAGIEFVKSKIESGEEPWATEWDRLKASDFASLDWNAEPRAHVERGPSNNPNIGSSDFNDDGTAAYTLALRWVLSGDEAYARKSAEIIDAWSSTLKTVKNHDARLLIGMVGQKYCNAAELLRHNWNGWPEAKQEQFRLMLRQVWYPVIKDFYPSANGNWDASMLQTMIAMGVFLDDREMFERAVNYYLEGEGNGAVRNYFNEFGECQESGRDQAHTQMGLEFLANTSEIAWNQGVDLYGAHDNRLLLGFEYTAKYNLGHEVPYRPYRSFEQRYHYKSISEDGRGRLRPMYEKVFNHYHHRLGLPAEYTKLATIEVSKQQRGRDGRRREGTLPWDTLMFHNLSANTDVSADSFVPDRQVTYKTVGQVELKLHIFEPQNHQATDQSPAILFFFGGGWNGGTPEQFYEQARALADRGMVAISAEYRVQSRHHTTPFECVSDGKSAIRWVRAHAKQLGIDPNKIVASGGSAGGHVAACTAMIEGHEQAGEDLTISSVPNAMVLFNPVLDTTNKGYGLGKVGEQRQTEISPCHHVRPGLPPTLLFHGTADTTVPFENAERFTRLMKEAGNVCQLEAFEKGGHGDFNGKFFRPKAKDLTSYKRSIKATVAFLTEQRFLESLTAN